jgi:hypothetical protein
MSFQASAIAMPGALYREPVSRVIAQDAKGNLPDWSEAFFSHVEAPGGMCLNRVRGLDGRSLGWKVHMRCANGYRQERDL